MNEPVWFRRPREASDRFAEAVDRPGHTAAEEFDDELAVVEMLRELGSEPVLEASARERMKAAVLAEAATIQQADEEPEVHPMRPTHKQRRKAGLWAAATAAGIVALGAFGIELAQSALPGEWLYDVKRTTESISLDLTFSPSGKALKQLELAEIRIAELAALSERDRSDGGATAEELAGYRTLIADLNRTIASASRAITSYAPQTNGGDLRTLRDWASRNSTRLADMRSAVPAGAVGQFDGSIELLDRVQQRASALLDRWSCDQITSGHEDALGALPADMVCQPPEDSPRTAVSPRASRAPAEGKESRTPSAEKTAGAPSGGESGDKSSKEPDSSDGGSGNDTDPPTIELPPLPDRESSEPAPEQPTKRPPELPLIPLLEDLTKLDLGLGLK